MKLECLVRQAGRGDLNAFVALVRHFEQFAVGTALLLVRDFQQAEDVVQESFLLAWSALPTLVNPTAFPGWLRGIVRHQAFRALRRKHLIALPLTEAEHVASEEPALDYRLEQRELLACVWAAINDLPASLREPATLFYVHECSHQDIAAFLGLSKTTVNNRLRATRLQLRQRLVTMGMAAIDGESVHSDFENRIGHIVQAQGTILEALFNSAPPPDILTELAVSDEVRKRGVTAQVVQRLGGGLVRCVATAPVDDVAPGSTVLSSMRHAARPVSLASLERSIPLLVGKALTLPTEGMLMETGIKVIDVMCPLVAGGSVAIAGEFRAGTFVVVEELVRRLSGGSARLTIFAVVPFPIHGSIEEVLKTEGYSEGTKGSVQTFFLRADDGPWTVDRLSALPHVDVVIHLSRDLARARIYPAIDPLGSRSRLLETKALSGEHIIIEEEVRQALAALRTVSASYSDIASADKVLNRAQKLMRFFAQPFFVAEPYTRRPGLSVSAKESLTGCREILDGQHDDLPLEAFYFGGSMAEIRGRAGKS
jgi:RNA polymerase sigma factor (sigma-70 family)